jgi:hypothetical protein
MWVPVQRSSVPEGVKIMESQYVLKESAIKECKARLVVRGDQEHLKAPPEDTYAPTPAAAEVLMLFAISTQLNRPTHSCYLTQAFTQSDDLKPGSQL